MADKSKSEKPTQHRQREARRKGDVPRSRDLVLTGSLFCAMIFFALYLPTMGRLLTQNMRESLAMAGERTVTVLSLRQLAGTSFQLYLKLLLPLFLTIIAAVFLLTVAQGGFKFLLERIKFKATPFQFMKGLRRIFGSVDTLVELLKTMLIVIVIGLIGYNTLRKEIPLLLQLPQLPLDFILSTLSRVVLKVVRNIVIFLLVLSIADYAWTRYRHTTKLMMSKQDIREEYKQTEGDPKIKGRIRQIQMQWAMRRMMTEVPKADVVITNPTHFAVALRYKHKEMAAPRVVAKGADLIALRIRQTAEENGVPVVENPPLARAIFHEVEIGETIGADLFAPVAEVLAYIYKLKNRRVG